MSDRRNRPPNRWGCKPTEDVCVAHDMPLECKHGCKMAARHKCAFREYVEEDGRKVDVLNRVDWETRFHARIADRARDEEGKALMPDVVREISSNEIESWSFDQPDWTRTTPEEAADEQMSNWLDDQKA